MQICSFLRILALSLVISSPMLQSGCSGGGSDEPDAGLSAEEDETLNPEDDSTLTDE